MLISVKNKGVLILDNFTFKCAIGKNGIKSKKKEGDKSTPSGVFSIGKLYYRADRVKKPLTKIPKKIIKKEMGWCDDPKSIHYNKEVNIKKKIKCEQLYRKDNNYDYFIVINYNQKKVKTGKGSAIFLHLTSNYKKTFGCVALKKKDFLIVAKLINKKTKIKIS